MTTFNEKFKKLMEEVLESAEDLKAEIVKDFKSEFPNGWIDARMDSKFGDTSMFIYLGLIGNKAEIENKIAQNDPGYHLLTIRPMGPDKYEAEALVAGLHTNPPAGSYNAMGTVKTGFRKTKGDAKKIAASFKRFFKKFHGLVKDNSDNVYKRDKYNDKYFK